jgi:Cytochrome c7 and related cytochrome c
VPAGSAGGSTPLGPQPVVVEMKTPVPSGMVDDLRALGLDAKNLPPISKLEPRTLRGVMKLMAKSLGVRCGDCHQEGDFAAPTRRKKIATHMWDEFAAKLSVSDGPGATGTLFCDSCHQGRTTLLDRRDKKALSKWMDDNFASRLTRKDGKSEECESCHADMEMRFLARWGQQ